MSSSKRGFKKFTFRESTNQHHTLYYFFGLGINSSVNLLKTMLQHGIYIILNPSSHLKYPTHYYVDIIIIT